MQGRREASDAGCGRCSGRGRFPPPQPQIVEHQAETHLEVVARAAAWVARRRRGRVAVGIATVGTDGVVLAAGAGAGGAFPTTMTAADGRRGVGIGGGAGCGREAATAAWLGLVQNFRRQLKRSAARRERWWPARKGEKRCGHVGFQGFFAIFGTVNLQ